MAAKLAFYPFKCDGTLFSCEKSQLGHFLLTSDMSFSTSADDLLLLSVFKEALYVFVMLHSAFFHRLGGGGGGGAKLLCVLSQGFKMVMVYLLCMGHLSYRFTGVVGFLEGGGRNSTVK